jgi:hypothetical protein
VVAGEIDHTKGLEIPESEIHQLEEKGIIRFLGSLGHKEMTRLYGIMDIAVLMTHREAVAHGVNGYLVRLSDTEALVHYLKHLISHQGLREQLGQAGRRNALAKFDEVVLAGKSHEVYEDPFEARRPHSFISRNCR